MEKVGNDGVITIEESNGLNTELEVVEGMQFDRVINHRIWLLIQIKWLLN